MDYSKLSDAALQMIESGNIDYSKLTDSDLAEIEGVAPPKEGPSKLESALRGAGQGLSMGFEDEIRAGLMAPFSDQNYTEIRDEIRAKNAAAQKENPLTYMGSEFGGGLLSAFIPGVGAAKAATLPGAIARGVLTGGLSGYGYSNRQGVDALKDTAMGAGVGGVAGAAAHGLGKVAERLAVRATGATGKQAERFAPNAGRELLDRKIVNFGSSPENIAANAQAQMDTAGKGIQAVLDKLDEQGGGISKDEIIAYLQKNVQKLVDNGQLEDATIAQNAIDRLSSDIDRHVGTSIINPMKLSYVEKMKRGFQDAWKNPETQQARKNIYQGLRGLVEEKTQDIGENLGEDLAGKFAAEKSAWGLLAPIQEAAAKRASQLNQRVMLGLLDTGAGLGGYTASKASGDSTPEALAKGLAFAGARHYLGPRLPSALAVLADKAGPKAMRGAQSIWLDLMNR